MKKTTIKFSFNSTKAIFVIQYEKNISLLKINSTHSVINNYNSLKTDNESKPRI